MDTAIRYRRRAEFHFHRIAARFQGAGRPVGSASVSQSIVLL